MNVVQVVADSDIVQRPGRGRHRVPESRCRPTRRGPPGPEAFHNRNAASTCSIAPASRAGRRRGPRATISRRARSGRDLHPLYRLRRRGHEWAGAAGTPADSPPVRVGRARPVEILGARREGHSRRRFAGRSHRPRSCRPSASPTSARQRSSGIRGPAEPWHNAMVGRTRAPAPGRPSLEPNGAQLAARSGRGCHQPRISLRRSCGGSSTASTAYVMRCGEARGDLRHRRQLGDLEPDRRHRRRSHVTDVDQREPDAAPEPARPSTGTTSCSICSASQSDAPPGSAIRRTGVRLRRGPAARWGTRRADRGPARRSARGNSRPGCFAPGEAKNTYGTGNFMLLQHGPELVAVALPGC